ncbi:MAG: hypothetical protein AAF587_18720 [Bacteroidota bacterium]
MATFRQAREFLKQFHPKKRRYGILFSKQGADVQELLNLEWTAKEREKVIDGLKIEHWVAPEPEDREESADETENETEEIEEPEDEWIFQTVRRGKMIRIHLSLSLPKQAVICWVFGAVKS